MSFASSLRKQTITKQPPAVNYEFVLVLDDIYDTFNVGGMYRVADAAGVTKIYHCGATPTPPDPKISRASVGLVNYLPWEKRESILDLIKELKNQGYLIIALEQTSSSIPLDQFCLRFFAASPAAQNDNQKNRHPEPLGEGSQTKLALVSGNETFGVKKEVCDLADFVVELPMYGINKSLNVVVATGIVLYEIRRKILKQ